MNQRTIRIIAGIASGLFGANIIYAIAQQPGTQLGGSLIGGAFIGAGVIAIREGLR